MGGLLIAVGIAGSLSAWSGDNTARRLATLTKASEPLFTALNTARLERGLLIGGLVADTPISDEAAERITDLRHMDDDAYATAAMRLRDVDLPGLEPALKDLQSANIALVALRPTADNAVRQRASARDQAIVQREMHLLDAWTKALVETSNVVESALRLVDPMVDQLLLIKRAAWEMRSAAGLLSLHTEIAVAGQPWTKTDGLIAAQLQGRIALAQSLLGDAAKRADIPKAVTDSITAAQLAYGADAKDGPIAQIDALNAGQTLPQSEAELRRRNTVALNFISNIAQNALREVVLRADGHCRQWQHWLMGNAALLVIAVLATAGGFLITTRRVSGPIQAMTSAMLRLAHREMTVAIPGLGRADEVGAMAQAVAVFRDEMIRCDRLEALEEAHALADAERSAQEAERALHIKRQTQVVDALAKGLAELAEGNLSFGLAPGFPPEYELLRRDFNAAIAVLCATMEDICARSNAISKGTRQMAASAEDLEARSEQNASHMEQMIAARDHLALSVEEAVTRSAEAQTLAAQTRREAEASGQVVCEAVTSMGEIEKSAQQIGQIIGIIDEIAFQTNLLALNAGVEAARAGEAGRGFAVVATEVRGLAQRAAESAKDIKALVLTSMRQVASGVRLVGETGKVLGRIQAGVTAIDDSIGHIASAAQSQSNGLAEITEAIQQTDHVTQQTTAIMASHTQAVQVLSRETDALTRTMGQFRLEPQKKAA